MISPEEALQKILSAVEPLRHENVPLRESVGRVLAQDIEATTDSPPFDTTAVDGFAVKAADVSTASQELPGTLRIKERIRAGALAEAELRSGEAAQIMTGAPMPPGADAVVMKEITILAEDGLVKILQAPEAGENIRRRGEDIKAGAPLLNAGALVRPYEIALLAGQGITDIPLFRRPRVGIIATGDELVEPHEALSPGKIRNSNGLSLMAAVGRWNAEGVDYGIVRDDPAKIEALMKKALSECDVLLVSGGVSVGDFDYTKDVLEKLGLQAIFWKVAQKPGKPLLFGACQGKPVFGLPGNPVSVLVCAEEYVRPAVEKLWGRGEKHPSYHLTGISANEYFKDPAKQQFLFCRASRTEAGFRLEIIRPQGSHMMAMASHANALAVGPIGVKHVKAGAELQFRWLK